MKEMLKDTGIVFLVCLLFTMAIFIFTPYPAINVVETFFEKNEVSKEPENFQEVKNQVKIKRDLRYDSLNKQNDYDLFLPKESGSHPVIIWVHGGAFISGNKSDSEVYAYELAKEGYAVVTMNYNLAPESKYPSPVIQLGDLYDSLLQVADTYQLDMTQLILAGDSAGAHIASQFVNAQVNREYSDSLTIKQRVPRENLKGVLLYCGIFSVDNLNNDIGDHFLANYFINRIGWAYLGEKNWQESEKIKTTNLLETVHQGFPPAFITDGNTLSFEKQAKQFSAHLKQVGTPVTTIFYPSSDGKIAHEYQFDLTTLEGQNTLSETKKFLEGL